MIDLSEELSGHIRGGGTLIVPSRERARAVRLAHAAAELAAGRQAWPSADVLPLSAWRRRAAEQAALAQPAGAPRVLSAAEEWFLWRECALEASAGGTLLDAGALGESLQRASELADDYDIPIVATGADSAAALLHAARRAFRARSLALGAASVRRLIGGIPAAAGLSSGAVALRGFDALPPALRTLGARAEPAVPAATAIERPADAQEELARIAAWCEARASARPDARLLVMLPGPAGGRQRLAALIRQALDPAGVLAATPAAALVGIEGGEVLARVPMIAHALTALAWLAGPDLELAPLCAWLCAPYWARPSESLRARLALMLRERGLPTLDVRTLLGALQLTPVPLQGAARELAAQLTRAAAALGSGPASARQWSERFAQALAAVGWPGAAVTDDLQARLLAHWQELLGEFAGLSASSETLERAAALELLGQLARRARTGPPAEDVLVTIAPVLADPVVRYDGIWVARLDAETYPQPVLADPFLPLAAQRAAGVPAASAAGRLAQARALLAAWRAATGELVLSAPAHSQDLELLPSPLLRDLPQAPVRAAAAWLGARLRRTDATESVVDTSGEPWNVRRRLPRGTRSLDLQNLCAFRAYAELRLGAVEPPAAEPGIPATERGLLLHAALEGLWQRLRDSLALRELAEPALRQLIEECVAHAALASLAQPHGRRRRGAAPQLDLFAAMPASLARECRRAARLIYRLCELERERPAFRVEQAEARTQLTLAGATLHMQIDRVDELEGGGRVLLDYKSGLRTAADWYGERPTHPQLLAYAEALGADVVALATVSLTARHVRFDGIARETQLLPRVPAVRSAAGGTAAQAWGVQRQAWHAVLERLVTDFVAGAAAVDPLPGACRYCPCYDICRISERAGAAVTHGDEHE